MVEALVARALRPWPITLSQVAFVTLMLMLAVLYTFLAKGWLK